VAINCHRSGAVMRRRSLALCGIGLLLILGLPGRADAHDLPDDLDVRLVVKPEASGLHVIARVPLALLEGVGLPKRGADLLNLARIDQALERAALAIARTFVFFENGERLTPDKATWRISLPSAPPFSSFDDARAQVMVPPLPPETDVVWNDGWFDVYLLYPAAKQSSVFELAPRLPGVGEMVSLHVDFVPPQGSAVRHDVAAGTRILTLGVG
jgi:hypothetical protein